MDERQFFNPFIFNNVPPNVSLPPNIAPSPALAPSPLEFYNNQYYYYRYLNEYLDYTIKSAEYEKKLGTPASGNNNNFNNNLKVWYKKQYEIFPILFSH